MRGVLGIFVLLCLAWILGERRVGDVGWRVPWRTVFAGLGLQALLAVILLRLPLTSHALLLLNKLALALQQATDQGTAFVFGYLGGAALPFVETAPGASFILAFKVLPLVLVISALSALLYYWGVLQAVTGAYVDLAKLPEGALGPRTRLIVTYALCGFANLGSLGILVGGRGAMVPERRREIASLGLRSILSGTIATCMSGAVAGLLA